MKRRAAITLLFMSTKAIENPQVETKKHIREIIRFLEHK